MDATEAATYQALLEEQRDTFRTQLSEAGADPDDPNLENLEGFDFGFADSAQSTAERSKVLAVIERAREGLKEVMHALEKIEKGTYGLCERCGEPIAPERLEALPATRLCLSCKQKDGHH
jgi:DnaK suppressor protein